MCDRGAQGIVAGNEFLSGRFAVPTRLRFRSEDRSDYGREVLFASENSDRYSAYLAMFMGVIQAAVA